jgi:hypothetical protein
MSNNNRLHVMPSNSFSVTVWLALSVKVKVKFILEQATKAQRGSRDLALLFS